MADGLARDEWQERDRKTDGFVSCVVSCCRLWSRGVMVSRALDTGYGSAALRVIFHGLHAGRQGRVATDVPLYGVWDVRC